MLSQAHLTGLELTYHSPDVANLEFVAPSIDLHARDDGALSLQVDGLLNGTEVSVSGSAGPLDNIVDGLSVDFDLGDPAASLGFDQHDPHHDAAS